MRVAFKTDDGFGGRAALGLVILQNDETIEAECRRMLDLPGVALHCSRILLRGGDFAGEFVGDARGPAARGGAVAGGVGRGGIRLHIGRDGDRGGGG